MPGDASLLSYDQLRDALDAAGIRVRAAGDALRVTRARRLTPALRGALHVHRARLLAECALPLWAQVYLAFGGGDVLEGRRRLSPRRVARELAALTQPGLDISAPHPLQNRKAHKRWLFHLPWEASVPLDRLAAARQAFRLTALPLRGFTMQRDAARMLYA